MATQWAKHEVVKKYCMYMRSLYDLIVEYEVYTTLPPTKWNSRLANRWSKRTKFKKKYVLHSWIEKSSKLRRLFDSRALVGIDRQDKTSVQVFFWHAATKDDNYRNWSRFTFGTPKLKIAVTDSDKPRLSALVTKDGCRDWSIASLSAPSYQRLCFR